MPIRKLNSVKETAKAPKAYRSTDLAMRIDSAKFEALETA
jgi:hypothetical protein